MAVAAAIVSLGNGQADEGGTEMAPGSLPRSAQPLLILSHWLQVLLPPCCISTWLPQSWDLPLASREKRRGDGWVRRGEQWARDSPNTSLHSSKITKNMILQYVIAGFEEAVTGFVFSGGNQKMKR